MALTITLIVIAAVLVIAVIYLIPTLVQIRRTSLEAEKFFETIRMQIVPLGHDLAVISKQVNGVLQSIHRQVEKVEETVTTIKDGAVRLRNFQEEVFQKVEEPLLEIATLFGAVGRGVGAFVRMLRR